MMNRKALMMNRKALIMMNRKAIPMPYALLNCKALLFNFFNPS